MTIAPAASEDAAAAAEPAYSPEANLQHISAHKLYHAKHASSQQVPATSNFRVYLPSVLEGLTLRAGPALHLPGELHSRKIQEPGCMTCRCHRPKAPAFRGVVAGVPLGVPLGVDVQ